MEEAATGYLLEEVGCCSATMIAPFLLRLISTTALHIGGWVTCISWHLSFVYSVHKFGEGGGA